jgi:cell division protein FtsB
VTSSEDLSDGLTIGRRLEVPPFRLLFKENVQLQQQLRARDRTIEALTATEQSLRHKIERLQKGPSCEDEALAALREIRQITKRFKVRKK